MASGSSVGLEEVLEEVAEGEAALEVARSGRDGFLEGVEFEAGLAGFALLD